jgi:hypothetical protein
VVRKGNIFVEFHFLFKGTAVFVLVFEAQANLGDVRGRGDLVVQLVEGDFNVPL